MQYSTKNRGWCTLVLQTQELREKQRQEYIYFVYLRRFLEKSTSLLYLYTYIACPCINQMLNRKSFCIICLVCLGTFLLYCYDCIYIFLYSTYFCYAYIDSSSVNGVDHPKKFIELVQEYRLEPNIIQYHIQGPYILCYARSQSLEVQ